MDSQGTQTIFSDDDHGNEKKGVDNAYFEVDLDEDDKRDEEEKKEKEKEKDGDKDKSPLNGFSDVDASDVNGKMVDDVDELDDDSPKCGWFGIRPGFIQFCHNPKGYLFFLCVFAVAQGMTVNGIVYVVTTTLERRFGLTSVRSGFISSCYDFSVMIVVVFVTYLGEKSHKPRWIGTGAFIFAMGSLLFTLPHFATDYYSPRQDTEILTCNVNGNGTDPCEEGETSLSNYYWVFVAAQVLHGLGASPLYTLGVTYMDDNVKPKVLAVYIGIFQAMSTVGPAFGYVLGGVFLSVYTDVQVDPADVGLTPESPLWVGGWWMGFFVSAFFCLLVVIPILGFSRSLPGSKALKRERKGDAQAGSDFSARAGFGNKLMDFPRAVWTLLKNIPFMCLNGAAITEWFILASIAVFGPKYLESQFNFTSGTAALIAGIQVIPASLIGCLVGGLLVRCLKLDFRGMVKFCIVCLTVSLLSLLIFITSCPNIDFAGVTVTYDGKTEYTMDEANVTAACNVDCQCQDNYDPVCGSDDVLYFSPCHAGCLQMEEIDDINTYSDCRCIAGITNETTSAKSGKCDYACPQQTVFLVVLFIMLTSTFFAIVPSLTATLRCVGHSQRAFGLGLQSLLYRALGTVPGPVVFGLLIDSTCLIWEEDCEGGRTCWMYDNGNLATYTLIMTVCLRILSLVFFVGALIAHKPIGENDATNEEKADEVAANGIGDGAHVINGDAKIEATTPI
ncbi:solute carrier organic anion transporter family member 4A1-like [Diadema antillarum]|uniref:solute carrier organic anion transporter family member 4A1-like n=1 Tax=Diadema antillarum TaxID=105358 RepID=UPI003A84A49F